MSNLSCCLIVTLAVVLFELIAAAPQHRIVEEEPTAEAEGRSGRLLEHFNHRYPDGSYEFRFELDDGTARYERGYFAYVDEVKTLMVVGYYSYRMPDGRYITVFYNADQFGYRQNQSITPETYPNLPRSIEVPVFKEATTTTTTKTTQQQSHRFQQQSSLSSSASTSTSSVPSSSIPTSTSRAPTRRGRY
ncbi:hypothetical protein KR044_011304 [Drosophila immigrans]|nr:hypothetical protein KR044_011304 [Drosophila immigrans]